MCSNEKRMEYAISQFSSTSSFDRRFPIVKSHNMNFVYAFDIV